MTVEQGRNSAPGAMPGDEQRVRRSVGVFLEQLAQTAGDGRNHLASYAEEASVAQIAGIVLHRSVRRGTGPIKLDESKSRLTKKPAGDVGAAFRLTAQSINVAVPRMANTIVFM